MFEAMQKPNGVTPKEVFSLKRSAMGYIFRTGNIYLNIISNI